MPGKSRASSIHRSGAVFLAWIHASAPEARQAEAGKVASPPRLPSGRGGEGAKALAVLRQALQQRRGLPELAVLGMEAPEVRQHVLQALLVRPAHRPAAIGRTAVARDVGDTMADHRVGTEGVRTVS